MKIYTKTGDQGETGLLGGKRVAKDDGTIEAVGALDETNCLLGVVLAGEVSPDGAARILWIQQDLFVIGAAVAAAQSTSKGRLSVSEARIGDLEKSIDELEAQLPPLDAFILPGGLPVSAALHHARAVCRRAERSLVALRRTTEDADWLALELIYLNRLSDLLFVMARFENHRLGGMDQRWLPEAS